MTPRQMVLPIDFAPKRIRAHGYRDAHTRPLVSSQLPTSFRVSPERAWKYPHIELRTANSWPLIGLDCDDPERMYDALVLPGWLASGPVLPEPNVVVQRRSTGRAHVDWFLEVPVHRGEKALRRPLRKYALISEWYRARCGADSRYRGVLTHNPCMRTKAFREEFQVTWGRKEPYTLDELASVIPCGFRMPREPTTEAGRNCALFESMMRWAGSPRNREQAVLPMALAVNRDTRMPLPEYEVKGLAKSVERYRREWIEQERYYTRAERSAWGRKLASVGAGERASRDMQIMQDSVRLTQQEIAEKYRLTQGRVSQIIAKMWRAEAAAIEGVKADY